MKFSLAIIAGIVGLVAAQGGGGNIGGSGGLDASGSGSGMGDDLGLGGGGGGCTDGSKPCTVAEQNKCCSGVCHEIAAGNGYCEKTEEEQKPKGESK